MLVVVLLAGGCAFLVYRSEPDSGARPPDGTEERRPVIPASRGQVGAHTQSVKVDWDETHQTIVGFGGSMGWIHPHPRHREKIFDLLFKELGVSVLRIRALGGEGGDEDCPEPVNDNADPNNFDWSKFRFKTTEAKNAVIIKAAQKRGVKVIISTAWSPPGWMKDSGERAGGGELKPEMLDEYAELWTAYVLAMKKDFGIEIGHLSIQNEPDLEYYYPTCGLPAKLYARAMASVRRRLKNEKLDVAVLGPDTCRIYHVPQYLQEIEAAKVNPGEPILTHLYDLSIPYERVEKDASRWRKVRDLARKSKRSLWLMETANYLSYGAEPASYREAMIWAQKIHAALVAGDCEVVCWWSLYFDKKGEALIYARQTEAETYEITPKFYTSRHWFGFVRPGMLRCTAGSGDKHVLVSAFRPQEAPQRVLVLINTAAEHKPMRLPAPGNVTWTRYETTADKHCAKSTGKTKQIRLPPQSVTTILWESVAKKAE